MDSKKPNRRGFLKGGAALAGLAAGGVDLRRARHKGRRQKDRRADRLWRTLPFRDLGARYRWPRGIRPMNSGSRFTS